MSEKKGTRLGRFRRQVPDQRFTKTKNTKQEKLGLKKEDPMDCPLSSEKGHEKYLWGPRKRSEFCSPGGDLLLKPLKENKRT